MNENSEDNFKQSLDSQNQDNKNPEMNFDVNGAKEQLENIGLGDVAQNLGKMGAMNRYQGNINLNDPNIEQNPLSNLMYNQNQHVVEEKSNKFFSFLDKYKETFGTYFNVELNDIQLKLKGSLIPLNKSFYQSIEIKADLYGPFWIFTTIIFLISLIGNFSSYIHAEDKEKFIYDYNHVPHAIFIIYGFGFGAPIILWLIMRFIFKIEIDLVTNMCIYGYSYTILVPILLICIIPFKLIATLALLYFLIHSCTFLFYNMYMVIEQKAPKSKYVVLGLLGGIQLMLFFFLKFYFFG